MQSATGRFALSLASGRTLHKVLFVILPTAMKTTHMLMFTVPIAVLAAGFSIGGRDGAIYSIIGAALLLIVSFWQAIKVVSQNDTKPK